MGLFSNILKEKRSSTLTDETGYVGAVTYGQFRLDNSAKSLSAYFAARELISNSIAQLPLLVKRGDTVDKTHVLNTVFKTGLLSKFILMKQLITDVIDWGNGICYIKRAADGTPINLIYCSHSSYTIEYIENKQQLFYHIPFITAGRIDPADVLHLYKNSFDGVNGKSITCFANDMLNIAKSADKAASNYYSSGCAVHGALSIKGVRKDAKEKARAAFQELHSGANASGLVILDDEMSYQQISSNANDSQLLETRQFNVTEIARFFNISPILLGDLSHSSYNDIEMATIEFIEHTLLPYIAIIEDEFTRKLFKDNETDYSIDLDENYLLRGNKSSMASYLSTLVTNGVISSNEARMQIGLPAKEGGDDLKIAYSDTKQNSVTGNTDKQEGETEQQSEEAE